MDGIGSDVAKEGVTELSYDTHTPPTAADHVRGVRRDRPPARDHPMPAAAHERARRTTSSRRPTAICSRHAVSGPVERVSLDRSYHVATIDHDQDLIIDTRPRVRRPRHLTTPLLIGALRIESGLAEGGL